VKGQWCICEFCIAFSSQYFLGELLVLEFSNVMMLIEAVPRSGVSRCSSSPMASPCQFTASFTYTLRPTPVPPLATRQSSRQFRS
jgi:hypothetical protein